MWYMTRIRDDTFEVSNEIGQHFVHLKSTNSPEKKKKKKKKLKSGLIQLMHACIHRQYQPKWILILKKSFLINILH
jgi:hypothetical protein